VADSELAGILKCIAATKEQAAFCRSMSEQKRVKKDVQRAARYEQAAVDLDAMAKILETLADEEPTEVSVSMAFNRILKDPK
jgi:hypothetical protein